MSWAALLVGCHRPAPQAETRPAIAPAPATPAQDRTRTLAAINRVLSSAGPVCLNFSALGQLSAPERATHREGLALLKRAGLVADDGQNVTLTATGKAAYNADLGGFCVGAAQATDVVGLKLERLGDERSGMAEYRYHIPNLPAWTKELHEVTQLVALVGQQELLVRPELAAITGTQPVTRAFVSVSRSGDYRARLDARP